MAKFPVNTTPADTTILEFSDKSLNKRVTVITSGNKEFELPLSLNLNDLLKELGLDSTERDETLLIISTPESKEDTLLVISKSGQRIQIVTKGSSDWGKWESDEESPDSLEPNDEVETDEKNEEVKITPKDKSFFSKRDFGFYLGLNNFDHKRPSVPFQQYDLRDWKSRYIALSFRTNATLIRGQNTNLAVSYGPELSLYNFMFENNNTVFIQNGQTSFEEAGFKTKKTKLTITNVNFPVLLNVGFKKERFVIGIGAYAGYRIGAYSKTKDTRGNREKVKDDFNLNNLSYGLTTELGKKNGLTFFMRYDLNQLFNSDQIYARDLQAFSFGIRL